MRVFRRVLNWMDERQNRPKVLALCVVLTVLLILLLEQLSSVAALGAVTRWIAERPFLGPLVFPSEMPEWKDRLAALLTIFGTLIAFLIWHWRDQNHRAQIDSQKLQEENARRDVNLKEFQELQLRAAGHYIKDGDGVSGRMLQTAALFQLRDFLFGKYGDSFRRPAFETIFSLWTTDLEKTGLAEASLSFSLIEDRILSCKSKDDLSSVRIEVINSRRDLWADRPLTPVSKLIREDASLMLSTDFSYRLASFDLLYLRGLNLIGLDLSGMSFVGSDLTDTTFTSCNFTNARFMCCDFTNTKFNQCNLSHTSFIGSVFIKAEFHSPTIFRTDFTSSDFRECKFESGNWYRAIFAISEIHSSSISNTNCLKSTFIGSTINQCNFSGVDFGNAAGEFSFRDASNLCLCKINGVSFRKSDLRGVGFSGSTLERVDFRAADLRSSAYSDIEMTGEIVINAETRFGQGLYHNVIEESEVVERATFIAKGAVDMSKMSDWEKKSSSWS